jgi:hypothetical protein
MIPYHIPTYYLISYVTSYHHSSIYVVPIHIVVDGMIIPKAITNDVVFRLFAPIGCFGLIGSRLFEESIRYRQQTIWLGILSPQ